MPLLTFLLGLYIGLRESNVVCSDKFAAQFAQSANHIAIAFIVIFVLVFGAAGIVWYLDGDRNRRNRRRRF